MSMYKVSLSIAADCCERQTPNSSSIWGDYQFFINKNIEDADFSATFNIRAKESECLFISPNNTVVLLGEPESIHHYEPKYLNQFNTVLTCQHHLHHKNVHIMQPLQPWHIGRIFSNGKSLITKTYDDFIDSTPPIKTKLISVISSNKAFTQGHRDRINFVLRLKEYYGDQLDIFGHGFNPIDDKWDAIAPYKYHITIENSSYPDYWTEKLADCFLGQAFPFYYGCPNVENYFDSLSFCKIDINDFEAAIKVIDEAISNDLYSERISNISLSKELILNKYNLFAVLANLFEHMDPNAEKQLYEIKSELSLLSLGNRVSRFFSLILHVIKKRLNLYPIIKI